MQKTDDESSINALIKASFQGALHHYFVEERHDIFDDSQVKFYLTLLMEGMRMHWTLPMLPNGRVLKREDLPMNHEVRFIFGIFVMQKDMWPTEELWKPRLKKLVELQLLKDWKLFPEIIAELKQEIILNSKK